MSCYEWEAGQILLPSAAVAGLRTALNKAVIAERERIQLEVERLWGGGLKDLSTARRLKLARTPHAELDNPLIWVKRWNRNAGFEQRQAVNDQTLDALALYSDSNGRKPTEKTYVAADLGRPTNRTTSWNDGALSIQLQGRTVDYRVEENNRAVDRARGSLLGKALFDYLGRVTWTRGTGGEIVGNNEYNRDSEYAGGGANFVTDRFGPLGQAGLRRH